MTAALPTWVGDATAICALLVGVAAVIGLMARAAMPALRDLVGEVVEKVTTPKFQAMGDKIDSEGERLDEHTRREEAQSKHVARALDAIVDRLKALERRFDDHLTDHRDDK